MIGGLASLSKTIDGLISGIIEFAYSIVSTIVRIYINPSKGALRSRILKDNVSSKTLLFLTCSATIAYLSYGAKELLALLNAASPGLFGYIVIVILFYVGADVCVVVLSFACARRNRRRARARELLRYCLAAVIGGWVFVVSLLFYIDQKFISPGEVFGNFFLIVKLLPYIAIALAYPLFTMIFVLRRNRGGALAPNLAATGVLGMGTLFVLMATLYLQPRELVDSIIADGSGEGQGAVGYAPDVAGFSCEEHRDKAMFEIRAAVYNPSTAPIVLEKRAVHARVFQRGENDKTSFSIEFPRAGQPLVTIAPKSVGVIAFDQPIDERMRNALTGTPVCSVYTIGNEESAPVDFVEQYPEDGVVEYGGAP
jgi:hypothetical protein